MQTVPVDREREGGQRAGAGAKGQLLRKAGVELALGRGVQGGLEGAEALGEVARADLGRRRQVAAGGYQQCLVEAVRAI